MTILLKSKMGHKRAGYTYVLILLFLLNGISILSFGQPTPATGPAAIFIKYSQEHLQEKIYAHTDKSFYVCGEILWFKLYNVDAMLNKPAAISKVAYVELLDGSRQPVLQAKVNLESGSGNGSFFLPFSLSSGTYVLRGYTSWMKNFSTELFFEKRITIINTLKRLPAAETDTVGYSIQFFPEGGNLVAGLESKLAFHAVDINGKGIDCKGVIYNQDHDSITSFAKSRFGTGSFNFTPAKGNIYNAVVQDVTGKKITRNLPAVYEHGYTMQLTQTDSGTIKIIIQSIGQRDNAVFLLGHTRQVLKLAQWKNLVNGKTEFTLDPMELGEGVTHFTLFNEMHQPLCERLYFRRPGKKLMVDIKIDQADYGIRRKVSIGLTTHDNNGQPIAGDLSISVFRTDSLQVLDDADIQSFFWLSSELRGKVERPSYYFSSTEKEASADADNLMLTQGWSRFKWENVLVNAGPVFQFLPEYEGMLIAGKIRNKNTGLPAPNVKTYLSVPGNKYVFRSSTSDKEGNVFFNVDKFYGKNEIIVQAERGPGNYVIDINSPFSGTVGNEKNHPFRVSETWKEALLSYSISSQVENVYTDERKQKFTMPFMEDTTQFFGKPDKTYWLDDYTRFISMEEVMREYVAEVRVRKEKDNFYYRVKNGPYNLFFPQDPLLLLDGVPVFDAKKLMEFDPLKIKKLDVVTRRYFTGNDGIEGIVSYTTYSGNLNGFVLDTGAIAMEYDGLQLQREFYSPAYETQAEAESPLPDFRNVLFWSPVVITNEKGIANLDFYTSDRPGTYAVVVQGMTANGLVGSSVHYFNVDR